MTLDIPGTVWRAIKSKINAARDERQGERQRLEALADALAAELEAVAMDLKGARENLERDRDKARRTA